MEKLQFLFDEANSYEQPEDKEKLEKLIEEIVAYEKQQ